MLTFNRTAYGIEILVGYECKPDTLLLLIAPLMELKYASGVEYSIKSAF